MHIYLLTRTILPACILLFGAAAWPQDSEEEQELAPKRYEVELIVFRHLDQQHNTPEVPPIALNRLPPLDSGAADDRTDSIFLADDALMNNPDETDPDGSDPSVETSDDFAVTNPDAEFPYFTVIEAESLKLGRSYRRLEQLDAYEPLLHLGWIQPALSTADAIPYQVILRMNEGSAANLNRAEDLSGTITLYKERYLHLELDLALEPAPSAGFTTPVIQNLKESRRVRDPSSHYFDHPRFGVIARIQLFEEAAESGDSMPDSG